jgi:hypothetical protein
MNLNPLIWFWHNRCIVNVFFEYFDRQGEQDNSDTPQWINTRGFQGTHEMAVI